VFRGGNLVVPEEGIRRGVREVMLARWWCDDFFSLYGNSACAASGSSSPEGVSKSGYTATRRTDSSHPLDRYLLAKTRDLIHDVTQHLDDFDTPLAAEALRDFAEVLTNWYVRRSRDRFWGGDDRDAFDTLFTVLETYTRLAAPLLPLVAEEIWQGLTGGRSVHLTDWPAASEFPVDTELVRTMDRVREVASSAHALRKARKLRVRLPLAGVTVVGGPVLSPEFVEVLKDELNVKGVTQWGDYASAITAYGIGQQLVVNARAAGPRLGKDVQRVIQAAKAGDWKADSDGVVVAGIRLEPAEYELSHHSADDTLAVAFLESDGFVVLDTELTPELEAEGMARDFIRDVQEQRKAHGLNVTDRIRLSASLYASAKDAVQNFLELVRIETLAVDIELRVTEAEPVIELERV
jgi:isoleucyl-tRNA synthetase